jgi:hypothetical protein
LLEIRIASRGGGIGGGGIGEGIRKGYDMNDDVDETYPDHATS